MSSTDTTYKYYCDKCKYGTNAKNHYSQHCKTTLHLTGKRKVRTDRKVDSYNCDICDYTATNHINYKSHKLNNHSTIEERKTQFTYYCDCCNFGVFMKSSYNKHMNTNKHKMKSKKK